MSLNRRTVLQGAVAAASTLAAPFVRAQPAPLKLGVMLPMSGIGAEAGAAWLAGIRAAQTQWNENGGLIGRQIEVVVRDDKFNSAGAVAAARELAGAGINLIIGGSQSPMALAVAPILPELKAVLVAPAPTVMSLTHESFNRYFFRAASNAYMAFGGIGSMLAQRFTDVASWTMILPDSENGRDMARYFAQGVQRQAAKSGRAVKVLEPIYASLNKADYRVEINQLMNAPSQGLFVGLTAAPCISLLQQGRSVGLDRKFKVIGDAGTEILIAKAIQKSLPANLWSISFWAPDLALTRRYPLSQPLLEGYTRLTGDRNPAGIVHSSHRAALGLFNAVKKANAADTDAVIAALEGLTYETAMGPYHVRKEDHQGYGNAYIAKVGVRDEAPGYGIVDAVVLDESQVVEPPSPGRKFEA